MPIALITGATAGIGAEFARQLAARGYDLVLVARDVARLESAASDLRHAYGVDVEVLPADLLDAEQCARVAARAASTDRPIDYLVNNAGFGLKGDFDAETVEAELRQFDLLARVPLELSHAALSQQLPRRTGRVVIVSSTAGLAGLGSYSAAKAWSLTFARWANAYYRTSGVTVTAVAPGFVKTEFHERMNVTRESMAPAWAWLDVERLVRLAMKDVDRGRAVSVPTVRYKVIAAFARAATPLIAVAVARRGTAARSSPGARGNARPS